MSESNNLIKATFGMFIFVAAVGIILMLISWDDTKNTQLKSDNYNKQKEPQLTP